MGEGVSRKVMGCMEGREGGREGRGKGGRGGWVD